MVGDATVALPCVGIGGPDAQDLAPSEAGDRIEDRRPGHPVYLPAARAINDFCHKIFIDGSIVELWGLHVFEESLSMWSGQWYTALTTHYGFSRQDAVYFSTHEEADMDTHKLGEDGEEATWA